MSRIIFQLVHIKALSSVNEIRLHQLLRAVTMVPALPGNPQDGQAHRLVFRQTLLARGTIDETTS